MARGICPNCGAVYNVMAHSGDYVHNCQDMQEVKSYTKEDVIELGTWEDYTGSGGEVTNFYRGVVNNIEGTKSAIEGEDVESVTRRGARVSTHRQRDKLTYIGDTHGN